MVGGMDKYFQIVKCFRDEDLRADRQPEFTQIDCEMAFVEQEDVLNTFEGLIHHLIEEFHNISVGKFPVMTYEDVMRRYGNDKPDIRFGMEFGELNEVSQHKNFNVFNNSELVIGIAVPGGNSDAMMTEVISRLLISSSISRIWQYGPKRPAQFPEI